MSRKQLEAFNASKLRPGHSKSFEVVNPTTGYHECHYFYRDRGGELFSVVTRNHNTGTAAKNEWLKLKRANPNSLIQMAMPAEEKANAK